MKLQVVLLYAGLSGLLVFALAMRVVLLRIRERVAIGHGDNQKVERAVRVHANAVENVPIVLVLLALLEWNQASAWGVHLAGGAFVLGRVLHASGMWRRTLGVGRRIGSALSFLVLCGLSTANLIFFFR